jgi:hypothetical protein
MRPRSDVQGKTFGLLTVIEEAGRDRGNYRLVRCKCKCGGERIVRVGNLVHGHTKTCGCVKAMKLFPERDAQIIALYRSGVGSRKIARDLNLSPGTVSGVVHRRKQEGTTA